MLLRRFAAATSRASVARFSSRGGASLVKELTEHAEYEQLIARPDAKSVVYFTAAWCGPCKMISPIYANLSNKNEDISFVKVDVDELDHTAHVAGVRSMPTFQFYANGKLQQSLGVR
ncbi:hypothetical protein AaE_002374 [Aphanomyces astaci]|uniref:Thioredoxin domain-containing protein n=1 Tax=Aphanomyces astaci TaxID=112090 RepID=A0A6A5AQ03_APHAT|nr:hypothetical protein AaE_002374 [Aphanomyces astaci]